jgi:phosphotransferase system, EIIB
MRTHGLWAHSRKGIEIPGRADGARCASCRFSKCVGASGYISALGGAENIVRVDACAETRGVLHLLVGLNADQDAAEMRGQLAAAASSAAAAAVPAA